VFNFSSLFSAKQHLIPSIPSFPTGGDSYSIKFDASGLILPSNDIVSNPHSGALNLQHEAAFSTFIQAAVLELSSITSVLILNFDRIVVRTSLRSSFKFSI